MVHRSGQKAFGRWFVRRGRQGYVLDLAFFGAGDVMAEQALYDSRIGAIV